MIDTQLISRVEDKVLAVMLDAQQKFSRTFALPNVSFELDSIRTAGKASYASHTIFINPLFLTQHPEEVIEKTVGHECAHLINKIVFPNARQHHGPEWKYVMRSLGLPESRCHSMELEGVKKMKKPHIYACGCMEHQISNTVHNRMSHGIYRCRRCKNPLKYVKTV